MDNLTFQKIKDIILKNQDIAVVVGSNPSLDQMAAGLGLFLVLKQMGKNAAIACPTDPIVALSSLVGIDKVQKTIGAADGSGDLTVSFPYKEGEIEKVSYTLDNGKLNIVVKAGERGLSFNQSEVAFLRASKMPSLLIFVGVSKLSDVASIYTQQMGVSVVNIDNKADNEKFGDIVVVDQRWSSVSEQVADFVTLLEPQIELNVDTAQNLLTGIEFATNDFTNSKTSYLAFEVAGILMKKGATRDRAKQIIQGSQTNTVSNPSQYFPSKPQPAAQQVQIPQQPVVQPQPVVSQPIQQPVQSSQPVQPQPAPQPINTWQPAPVTSPIVMSQPAAQPVVNQQSQTVQTPIQSESISQAPKQAPPDWLTPKVYKGSTVL